MFFWEKLVIMIFFEGIFFLILWLISLVMVFEEVLSCLVFIIWLMFIVLMLYQVGMCILLLIVIGSFGVWGKMNFIVVFLGKLSFGMIGLKL